MAQIIPGDDSEKVRPEISRSPSCAAKHSNHKHLSGRTTSRSMTKSSFPHYHKYLPPPPLPYYAAPPYAGYYHPHFFHYPPIHRHHWPIAPITCDHDSLKSNSTKASTTSAPPSSKTDIQSIRDRHGSKNSTKKQKNVTKKSNANIAGKKSATKAIVKNSSSGEVVIKSSLLLHNLRNFNSTPKIKKSALPLTKPSSARPIPSSNKGKAFITKVECMSTSLPAGNERQSDLPSCDATKDPRGEMHKERVQLEERQVFPKDIHEIGAKADSWNDPAGGKAESFNLNDVTDPLDLKLMFSANFVTFKNIGEGLDKHGCSSMKINPETTIDALEEYTEAVVGKPNAIDVIHDANPPFPVDDAMETDNMEVSISLHSLDEEIKGSLEVSSDKGSTPDLDAIFRIPSTEIREEDQVSSNWSHNKKSVKYAKRKVTDEVDDDADDACLDSFIRSLISEDEEDSLVRPSDGFSPTTLPEVLELTTKSLMPFY